MYFLSLPKKMIKMRPSLNVKDNPTQALNYGKGLFFANCEAGSPWLNCFPYSGSLVSSSVKFGGGPRLPIKSHAASLFQNVERGRTVLRALFTVTGKWCSAG